MLIETSDLRLPHELQHPHILITGSTSFCKSLFDMDLSFHRRTRRMPTLKVMMPTVEMLAISQSRLLYVTQE